MAYNDDNSGRNRVNSLVGVIKGTLALSPLVLGAYAMRDRIRTSPILSAAVPGSGAPAGGRFIAANRAVGAVLGRSYVDTSAKEVAKIKKFMDQILETDAIKSLVKTKANVPEIMALGQALLEAADDPTVGVDLKPQKARLYDLLRDLDQNFAAVDSDELQKTIKDMVGAIKNDNASAASERLYRAQRQYQKRGGHLRFPIDIPVGKQDFDIIDPGDFMKNPNVSAGTKAEYQRLLAGLSADPSVTAQIVSRKLGGEDQYHARVYSGAPPGTRGSAGRWLHTLPLGDTGLTGAQYGEFGGRLRPVFTGQALHTMYQAPALVVTNPGVIGGKFKSPAELSAVGTSFNKYQMDEFLAEFKTKGRRFVGRDFRLRMSRHLQLVPRSAYEFGLGSSHTGASGRQILHAAIANNNLVVFPGLKTSQSVELAKSMAEMAATQPHIFSAYAPGQEMISRTDDNFVSTGKIGLAGGDIYGGLQLAVPLDRSLVPPRYRIEQVSGRDTQAFAASRKPGGMGRKDPFATPVTAAPGAAVTDPRMKYGPLTIRRTPKIYSKKPGSRLAEETQVLLDEAIGVARGTVTGGTNKAILVDHRVDAQELAAINARRTRRGMMPIIQPLGMSHTLGDGIAVTTRSRDIAIRDERGRIKGMRPGHADRIDTVATKQLPDPAASKYLASDMFNEAIRQIDAAGGRPVWFTKREILNLGGDILGVGADGIQGLRDDPNVYGMFLNYKRGFSSEDKPVVVFEAVSSKTQGAFKAWGGGLKATVEVQGRPEFQHMLRGVGYNESVLKSYNIPLEHVVMGDASMHKKGIVPWLQAMQTGYQLTTGDTNSLKTLTDLAKTDHYGIAQTARYSGAGTFTNQLKMLYGGTVKGLSGHYKRLASAGKALSVAEMNLEVARVLALVLHRGHGEFSFLDPQMRFSREEILNPLRAEFGPRQAKDIFRLAYGQQGEGGVIQLGAGTLVPGPSIGDWGVARGSTEPRMLGMLMEKLQMRGDMSADDAAEAMASIFESRVGGSAPAIRSTQAMIGMMNTLYGRAGLDDVMDLTFGGGLTTYNLNDLGALQHKGIQQIARDNPDGFYIDFAQGDATARNAAIRAAAVKHFGNTPIRFPGRNVTDFHKETQIKVRTGDSSDNVSIQGRYGGRVEGLLDSLLDPKLSGNDVDEELGLFKRDMTELTADLIHNVGTAKVRGMTSYYNRQIDLNRGVFFNFITNPGYPGMVKEIYERSRGSAVFIDANGLLSQLSDWMGSQGADRERAARTLHDFFMAGHWQREALEVAKKRKGGTLSESEISAVLNKARGAAGIADRHPFVGPGNFSTVSLYRMMNDLQATGAEDQDLFRGMAKLTGNRRINSWDALDKAAKRAGKTTHSEIMGYRMEYFRGVVDHLDSLAPSGGGSIWTPKATASYDVMRGGVAVPGTLMPGTNQSGRTIDLGIVTVSTGDWDGDTIQVIVTNKQTGEKITRKMTKEQLDAYVGQEMNYRIRTEEFKRESKASLKNVTEIQNMRPLDFDDPMKVAEGLRSEDTAKKIGSIDRRLNSARYALLDLSLDPVKRDAANSALALLGVTQEHVGIKAGGAPRYFDFIQVLGNAMDRFSANGVVQDETALREFFEKYMFKGSYLLDGPVDFGNIGSDFRYPRQARGLGVDVQAAIDVLMQAMAHAKQAKFDDLDSAARTVSLLAKGPEEEARVFSHLHSGSASHIALVQGFMEESTGKPFGGPTAAAEAAVGRAVRGFRTIDHGLLGIGAAALGGALAVGGMINYQGYAPTPMVMPGEVLDPAVSSRLGRGILLNEPTPQQYEERASYSDINTPHHTPQTYLAAPNAYNIRGTVRSANGLPRMANYLNNLGGNVSGSIRINDTRRPISSSYIDRAMGEY